MSDPAPQPLLPASQREVDLLNATVFGVQGQGGLLREMADVNKKLDRIQRVILYGAISMATALVGLAIAVVEAIPHG